ncbi:MAG: hypothetical protein ACJ761_09505 [Chloroflexota bacterium]
MTTPAANPDRPWNAVTRAIDGPTIGGLAVPQIIAVWVLITGVVLTSIAAHGHEPVATVAAALAGAVATGLITAVLNAWARPPRARRAFEAFVWLGEWELDRLASLGSGTIRSLAPVTRYVEQVAERPEDRWVRVEELGRRGRIADARAMAERMPEATAYDRVERAAALTWLDWLSGGTGDPSTIRAAVDAVEPADGDERGRAEVVVACADVRHRLASGGPDPLAPLLLARDWLGRRADGILMRMTVRAAPQFVQTAIVCVAILVGLDVVGLW